MLFWSVVSVLLTTGLGALALSRARFDPLGRVLLAFLVGQALLTVAAGVLDAFGWSFGVVSASLIGLALAVPAAFAFHLRGSCTITAPRPAAAGLLVLVAFWGVQAYTGVSHGIHHFDFTYHHDVMARSLAHSGKLSEPYLTSISFEGWYLVVYGSSVVLDAFNALLVPDASRLAWYLNTLVIPAMLLLLVAQRAGPIAAFATAVAIAALFPLLLLDVRPNYTAALMLGIANVAVLTSRAETRAGDAVLLAILTACAVFAKREAFIIFFFPCALFLGILLRDRRFALAARFCLIAGIPTVLTLVYRIAVPEHAGLSVGMPSQVPLTELLVATMGIVGERLATNNGHLAVALGFGLVGAALQRGTPARLSALALILGQFIAFAMFVYVTYKGGLNNFSTDWRKAVYPLVVGAAFFGIGVGTRLRHVRIWEPLRLAAGVAAGIAIVAWLWDATRSNGTYDVYLRQQANWNALLDVLDRDRADLLLIPGEDAVNVGNIGYLPVGLIAAVYPRQVRVIRGMPQDPPDLMFLASDVGPVPGLEPLGGRILETSWGLRYWTSEPVPREATNGWSLDNPVPDVEADVPVEADEDEVVLLNAWGSVAAIAPAGAGAEIDLTLRNTEGAYLTRLLLDPYPGQAQDAPVHVEVRDADGALLHASQTSELPRFGSWIVPLRTASPEITVRLRVGETGTLRFFRPRVMTPVPETDGG
ncbi:hypothetical protein [Salinarimonas chemoclinalis]|uniref:hypothetical protein n=1 Tax=Salinarimonas chemoclinalis TaxID=3241599 RepID=UPI003558A6FE